MIEHEGNPSKYRVELQLEDDGTYTAIHPELPGCVAWGDSVGEAVANLTDSREAWIEGRLASGFDVPAPIEEEESSGRVTLRIPRFVHAELVQMARREEVSLNALISTALTAFVSGAGTTRLFRQTPWEFVVAKNWSQIATQVECTAANDAFPDRELQALTRIGKSSKVLSFHPMSYDEGLAEASGGKY